MKTKDHKELSDYLMTQFHYPVKKELRRAVILGSIEPDYNPITYLRGSLKIEKFRGHNFENAHHCIKRLIYKIETGNMSEIKRCYLLGKLLHYVADAFTFPHNKAFKGTLAEHCSYEMELHGYMERALQRQSVDWVQIRSNKSLMDQIDDMHQKYLDEPHGYRTDFCYILDAVALVFEYFSEEYADCWKEQAA